MESVCKEAAWWQHIYGFISILLLYILVKGLFLCFALDLIRFWLFLQVVKLSNLDVHTCCSSTTVKGREATINWLSRRSKDIVKEDPSLSAKKLQKRLQKQYNVDLSYWKVWSAKKSTMNDLHGTWEEGFTMLWRFKAALEESCPGSIVEIDCKKIDGKMHFSRMFVCIRACADGFLAGCRPYLGVDSTHLT